jgi:hypothetical protein
MSTDPAPLNAISPMRELGEPDGRKRTLFARVVDEVKKFAGMALYLWVVFGLFVLHERIVLAERHIDYRFYGFAVVNAFVLAKVMLVAEDLGLGERFKSRALVYPILYKSILFAIVFMCFYVVEEVLVGVIKGKTILASMPSIGGGSLDGIISVGVIVAVALIPFFAFREVGRAIGEQKLRALLLTRDRPADRPQVGLPEPADHG